MLNHENSSKGERALLMIGLILILFGLIFGAAGCLKPVSLEDYGYVISVGVDAGKEKQYYFTLMLQRESSGQNSAESEGGAIVLAAEGDDIFEAVNTIESNLPYMLNFSRTGFLFFSRKAAEEGLLESFLEIPLDTLRIRASAIVIVTESDVGEFVGGLAANNDANITKLQSAILLDRDKTGMVAIMSVSRLYEACIEGRYDFCSAIGAYDDGIITDMNQKKSEGEGEDPVADAENGERIGGLKSYITGAALFNGWRMSGTIDRHETMLLNMITKDFKTGLFVYEDGGGTKVSVQLEMKASDIRFGGFDETGAPCFEIGLELYGGIRQAKRGITVEQAQAWLDENVAERLEAELMELFEKCRTASCDAMRLGTVISKEFSSAKEWESFDWKSRYASSKVRFSVKIRALDKYSAEGMQ